MTDFNFDPEGALCADYDVLATGLESYYQQLHTLHQRTTKQGTVSRDQVNVFLTVSQEGYGLVPNAFTARPTATGLRDFVVSLEAEKESIFKRAVAALMEFLKVLWEKIVERLTGRSAQINRAAAAVDQIVAQTEALAEIHAESPEAAKAPPTPEAEEKYETTLRGYTELTKLSLTSTPFTNGITRLVEKLPSHFQFLELLIKDYAEQLKTPPLSEAQDFVDSQSMKMVRSSVAPAVKQIDELLKIPGVKFEHNPIRPSEDEHRPDELVLVETVSHNATELHRALGELHDQKAVINSKSEMTKMIENVDRLQVLIVSYRTTLDSVKEISQQVLRHAKGFDAVPGLSANNATGNKFDHIRIQAEFIKYASRLFKKMQEAGDLVLSDSAAFLFAVRSLKSQQINDALKYGNGPQVSAIRRKLSAKLEEIASKHE